VLKSKLTIFTRKLSDLIRYHITSTGQNAAKFDVKFNCCKKESH